MKKKAGSQLALYPTPVTVIGAMNGEKLTWTLAVHAGIMGYDRVLVSLAAPLVMECTVVDNMILRALKVLSARSAILMKKEWESI